MKQVVNLPNDIIPHPLNSNVSLTLNNDKGRRKPPLYSILAMQSGEPDRFTNSKL